MTSTIKEHPKKMYLYRPTKRGHGESMDNLLNQDDEERIYNGGLISFFESDGSYRDPYPIDSN